MVGLQEKNKIKKKFENRFFQIARFLGGVPLKTLLPKKETKQV